MAEQVAAGGTFAIMGGRMGGLSAVSQREPLPLPAAASINQSRGNRSVGPRGGCSESSREAKVVQKFGIGQPVRRLEDPRFITGRGRYVDDIDLPLPGLWRRGDVAARARPDQAHRHRQGEGGAGRARGADRRRRRSRQARQSDAGDAGGYGRPEGLPHAAPDPRPAARCARSATASPSSSPRLWRRRAMPPS